MGKVNSKATSKPTSPKVNSKATSSSRTPRASPKSKAISPSTTDRVKKSSSVSSASVHFDNGTAVDVWSKRSKKWVSGSVVRKLSDEKYRVRLSSGKDVTVPAIEGRIRAAVVA